MIFVTGDTHCPIDIHKLNSGSFDPTGLTRDDYLIICGDAGFVWYGRDEEDLYWQKWLQEKPWTTLFVDGNHENHEKLDSMPVEEWNGGKVHFIQPDIIHLMRGQIFDICGRKFFTMGGAASHDKEYRIENESWWARELPSEEELGTALDNLEAAELKVDYVISHCCPTSIQRQISQFYGTDSLTEFFEVISKRIEFEKWFFGHYHVDFPVNDKFECLYYNIKRIL